jgi:hypothetical protein
MYDITLQGNQNVKQTLTLREQTEPPVIQNDRRGILMSIYHHTNCKNMIEEPAIAIATGTSVMSQSSKPPLNIPGGPRRLPAEWLAVEVAVVFL